MTKRILTDLDVSSTLNATGNISTSGWLYSNASSADEGGQIVLAKPTTNTGLSSEVVIDIYQNKLRFFEYGGSNRGYYVDITSGAGGAGTSLTGGSTGAMNYAQTEGTKQSAISAAGTTIVSVSITTNGYPVLVQVTGDVENNSAGGWTVLQLYRGSTAIGNPLHTEGSAASENAPYALGVIDTPAAGTYTYALKLNNSAGGTFNFGESDGPVITAIELSGPKGDTGSAGATYTLPAATSTTLGGIELFSDTAQTTAANSVTTTASRTYGLQANASGQAVVNVPWTDTNTFPTTWTWTGGTTAGPTASITGTSSTISVAAVPVASATASGVITTGAQTLAGRKTFTGGVTVSGAATTIELDGDPGAAGQILTSQGGAAVPIWTNRNSPTFIVRKTATQVIAASTNTIVNFNTSGSVVANTGSAYSMTGGRVTVPNTGNYRIKATAYWDAAVTTGNNKVVFIYINASPATRVNAYGGLTYDFISETGIEEIALTAGDVVDVRVYQTSPSNVNLLSGGSSQLYAYGTSLMIQYKGN